MSDILKRAALYELDNVIRHSVGANSSVLDPQKFMEGCARLQKNGSLQDILGRKGSTAFLKQIESSVGKNVLDVGNVERVISRIGQLQ
jgi:hypothetical protein